MPTSVVTAETTAAATAEPFHYMIQPGDTLEEIATRFNLSIEALQDANAGITTLEPGENLIIPRPTPLPLDVQAPTCYETTPGNLLCLGRIDNPLEVPVESVTVEVSLFQADGTTTQRRTTVEQILIPAGSFAPYQASFAANDFNSVHARLVNAEDASDVANVMLLVQDVEAQVLDGRVVISAVITNPDGEDVELLRAFITLLDSVGKVIGYRVLVFETGTILGGGEQYPLQIEVTPQVSEVSPEYHVYVEGRSVP